MVSDFKTTTMPNTAKHIVALLTMLFGPLFVFGMVLVMNRMDVGIDRNLYQDVSQVAVIKNEPPKQDSHIKKLTQKPKPKVSRPSKAPAPIPQLNTGGLSGLAFGLGTADMDSGSAVGDDNKLLGDTQAATMTEDSVDTLPQPKEKSAFVYPPAAKKSGVEGYVVLSILIDVDGTVNQVQVIESSPQGVFDDSAVMGIKNWRFVPAQYQGKAVKVWAKQKIRFGLGS